MTIKKDTIGRVIVLLVWITGVTLGYYAPNAATAWSFVAAGFVSFTVNEFFIR